MEIEKVCSYFGDCKPKHIRKFQEKTPKGNCIEGYICRKPNRYLGSLLITKVNGESTNQFVQSMPKIEYFNDDRNISLMQEDSWNWSEVCAYEKLDGSCLIVYPLLDSDGFILEVVPKTRGRAVADSNFLKLYKKCDRTPIYEYYYHKGKRGVLFFEMYGILNQHDIIHYDTGIDLALIGCYTTRFFKSKALKNLCAMGFKQPDMLFEWSRKSGGNYITITTEKYRWWFSHIGIKWEDREAPTPKDAVSKMVEFLEYLNAKFNEQNGRIATEGVVINCTDSNGDQKYIKVKPRDIEIKHRSEKGIPRRDIVKEVLKYFDDYDSEMEEIYKKDPNHHTEYLHRMLSEDYPEEFIQKSKKKIEDVFMQVWDSRQVPISIHNICDELVEKYGNQGITHCMRMFAQEYPTKKKQARTIYQTLEIKFKRKGLEL